MGDTILDGKGRGYVAGVNEENRLMGEVVSSSVEHHANHHEGMAYNMLFDTTPTGAGDCFLYIKNTSATDMIIEGLWLMVGSAEQILIKLGDIGTPSGGSAVTPGNLNAGTNNAAEGTFQAGNDITGLSRGVTVEKIWAASTKSEMFNFEQDIVVPENGVFTLYAVTGGIDVNGTVVLNYHKAEN